MTLFAFIGIWWATAGVGAIAVGIPVIIHLINRRRFKIVEWAAMKFLLNAQKQTRKRMRIEQLLLLLCRMMILGLLLLAMAAITEWGEQYLWGNPVSKFVFNNLGLGGIFKGPVRQHRIHHIFVLDASLSMNQKVDGEQTAFERAKDLAIRKIDSNPAGDAYSILLLKDSPQWLVGEAANNKSKVIKEIKDVQASHGNASLAAAFSMVSGKLGEQEARFKKNQAVYFFTDMQRATWQAAAPSTSDLRAEDGPGKERRTYLDMQSKATTVLVDCGPKKDGANLAVTGLEFDPYLSAYLTPETDLVLNATIENFSEDAKKDLRVEVLIGRAPENANDPAFQMRVVDQITPNPTIPGREKRELEFSKVRFPSKGTYVVQVRISDDALNEDNTRAIVVSVNEKIPILLVNGKASVDRFERATEYLRLALNPFPAGAEAPGWPLRPEVVDPGKFSDLTEAQLAKYDCIFWCDVGQFGVNEVRKIETHLRRGGGFVVSMGKDAAEKLDRYNDLLHNEEKGNVLLPAMLMKKIVAPADHHFYMNNTDAMAFKLPPLAAFINEADKNTLKNARFRQYVLAKVPETKARTVLSFMTEVANAEKVKRDPNLPTSEPAIVEWNPPMRRHEAVAPNADPLTRERQPGRYKGKVILLTSTVNMDWTAWPGSPSYGAMMHELTRLALSGRLREQNQSVGDTLEEYLPGGAEIDVAVYTPNKANEKKKFKTIAVDDLNLFRYTDTDFAGIYRVETSKGFDLPFAVNVPTRSIDNKGIESDLSRLDEGKLSDLFPDWTFKVVKNATDVLVTGGSGEETQVEIEQPIGPDIAAVLLVVVLSLLFAEILLAWLFGHYTTTSGALTNAPAGPMGTTIAAAIAIFAALVFAVGAYVVLDFWITGDFLGFFPTLIRTWFERQVGLEPALLGEGSTWNYDQQSRFFGVPNENWFAGVITVAAIVAIFITYRAEAPTVALGFKLTLGAIRLMLILFMIWFILPRPQIVYERTSNPDLVILIDDTRSMGEPDVYQKEKDAERVKKLGDGIRDKLVKELPERIDNLEKQIEARRGAAQKDPEVKLEIDGLQQRLNYWQKQRDQINTGKWRPSRLQLVQAVLTQPEPHWLKTILGPKHKTKVHIFHLDAQGRATKLRDEAGDAGDLIDIAEPKKIDRAMTAISRLEPVGNDSRLGTAIKQVIDHYRGSGLSQVIMFTDGVTTRDENIVEAGVYASLKGIPLMFIGVGDEQQLRDLRLTDMQVENPVYLGDNVPIEVRLTGKGYKDLSVTVVLRVEDKDGKEHELKRQLAKVDPSGQATRIRFEDQPKELGKRKYIIQVEPPKVDPNEKPITPANLRQERTIEVIDTKQINVLYVEGQPRYEFRYIKFLMEREPDEKQKKKSIDLTVLLLDADPDWPAKGRKDGKGTDRTAISDFPPDLAALKKYDVLIIGDCDPKHQKLKNHLMDIKRFALGENEKGQKDTKPGGGVLFIAGSGDNPHHYKNTPLADILPVEPTGIQREVVHDKPMRPLLTDIGAAHPIFRFRQDERESKAIFSKLQPMYWNSTMYKANKHADVLAVHQSEKAAFKNENIGELGGNHPLVVQQIVGTGRSMFFGFDETWRWRFREDESKFNHFWLQTMRYLSRTRPTQTTMTLDRQVAYHPGDEIKITVTFPDIAPGGSQKSPVNDKTDVKVTISYRPPDAPESKDPKRDPEVYQLQLAKVGNNHNKYEGKWNRTREGKYIFRLTEPDVTKLQPDGKKPSAEATVELPPGELDRLRMNYQEMTEASSKTLGEFYTIAEADSLLDRLRAGSPNTFPLPYPPTTLWNQWWVYLLVLVLITSEWVLRKLKHLL